MEFLYCQHQHTRLIINWINRCQKPPKKHDCDQHPQKAPIVFLLPRQRKDLLNSDKITTKGDLPFFSSFRHLPPFFLSWDLTLFSHKISTTISHMSIFKGIMLSTFLRYFSSTYFEFFILLLQSSIALYGFLGIFYPKMQHYKNLVL